MNIDRRMAAASLLIGLFGCIASWLAVPQIQQRLSSPSSSPTTSGASSTNLPPTGTAEQPTRPLTEPSQISPESASPTTPPVPQQPASPTTDFAKTIIVGMTQFPDTLFGIESKSSATTQVLAAMQPGCVTTLNYGYQPVCFEKVPSLNDGDAIIKTIQLDKTYPGKVMVNDEILDASSLDTSISIDQMQVTWKIKDGLKWEDGEPLTADDFLFAAQLYANPGIKVSSRFVLERTEKFEKVDSLTFTWYGIPGYNDTTYFTNFFGPEPEHILSRMNPAEIGTSEYANHPLAYGPYKLVENVPQESTTLVANENYWGASQGLPKVGNIIFKYLSSEDQVLQQLESGEIDVVGQIGLSLRNAPALDELERTGTVKGQYVPATVWEHLDFGVQRGDGQASFFDDIRVRQAVAHAIDRQRIIDDVLFGKTVIMHSFLPSNHWAYPEDEQALELYPFDPSRAKALLDEAGWIKGADGIRQKDGRKFLIEFYTTENNQTRQLVSEMIQENLKAVGIDVQLNFIPGTAVLFAAGADGILTGRRYDLALYAWVSGPEPSVELYTCSQIPTAMNTYAGQNNTGWCNEEFDTAASESKTRTTRDTRLPSLVQAQRIFTTELPTFPLYQRVYVGAYRTNITGVALNATSQVDFWNIETWDITE